MYSLCFLFFFSLLDDGGSCWFRLVVASVGAGLWSDSLMLSLLWLELLRCDFVGFVGRLFLGWRWRKRGKNERVLGRILFSAETVGLRASLRKSYILFSFYITSHWQGMDLTRYYFSLTKGGPHRSILLLTHKGWTTQDITSHSQVGSTPCESFPFLEKSALYKHEFVPTRHEAAADISKLADMLKLATWGFKQE